MSVRQLTGQDVSIPPMWLHKLIVSVMHSIRPPSIAITYTRTPAFPFYLIAAHSSCTYIRPWSAHDPTNERDHRIRHIYDSLDVCQCLFGRRLRSIWFNFAVWFLVFTSISLLSHSPLDFWSVRTACFPCSVMPSWYHSEPNDLQSGFTKT